MSDDNRPFVIGVGMTAFARPSQGQPYDVMAEQAGGDALTDAGIGYEDIEAVYAGYVYGESTCGQRAAYRLGLSGAPVHNVNNNCATGSSALSLARQAILAGEAECVLALGFEQMPSGSLGMVYQDRGHPLGAPHAGAGAGLRTGGGTPDAADVRPGRARVAARARADAGCPCRHLGQGAAARGR